MLPFIIKITSFEVRCYGFIAYTSLVGGRQANDKNRSSFSLNLLWFMDYAIVLYSLWVRAYFQIAL